MQLKINNVYLLPNGLELIVRCSEDGIYLLHDSKLGPASAPVYWVNEKGQLLSWGRTTAWSAKDLYETGRLIDYTPGFELC